MPEPKSSLWVESLRLASTFQQLKSASPPASITAATPRTRTHPVFMLALFGFGDDTLLFLGRAFVVVGERLREFRSEQKTRRRVVDPGEDDHQRAGRAVRRGQAALGDVESRERLPDREENRGDQCAEPDIAPLELHVGKKLE